MRSSVANQLALLGVDAACLHRATEDHPSTRDAAARLVASDRLPCTGEAHVRCRRCGLAASIRFRCAGRCETTCEHDDRAASALLRAIPRVPVRHWVLTLPGILRAASAVDQALVRALGRTFIRVLFEHVTARVSAAHDREGLRGPARCGAVTLVHRAARALVFDVHVHALVLDGGYFVGQRGVEFVPLGDDPTEDDLRVLAVRTREAVLAAWGRRRAGADADELRALRVAHAATTGPVAKTAMRRLAIDRVERRAGPTGTGARNNGIGVHAMPRIGGDDRGALHRLAHYLVRAPVALGRLDRAGPDRVVHRLSRPFADGTTHVEFSSDELARRLVGLASAEPVHRVGYHGALARGALVKWRAHALQLALVEVDPTLPAGRRVRERRSTWPAASCTRCGGPLSVVALEESSEPRVIDKSA